jgi:hypothetical protein
MRVLLIEDEPTTAKSIELMLGTEGFNVYTTDLGEEGLDLGCPDPVGHRRDGLEGSRFGLRRRRLCDQAIPS